MAEHSAMIDDTRIKIEVWRASNGLITVMTDLPDGGGTRLCGDRLHAYGSALLAEFWLDEPAIDALVEDFEACRQWAGGGGND